MYNIFVCDIFVRASVIHDTGYIMILYVNYVMQFPDNYMYKKEISEYKLLFTNKLNCLGEKEE